MKREPKTGKTASYEIVFRNGATVTLHRAQLQWVNVSGKKCPKFVELSGHQHEQISWDSTGGNLDPSTIEAIFRLDED